jgi:hypothetical protein
MIEETEKYKTGWSDPRAIYGTPQNKDEPVRHEHERSMGAGVIPTVTPVSQVPQLLLLLTP